MGKITVNHYLNTNLKPYIVGKERYYKIYFLLRYQNKNTKIRSLVSQDEYTEAEFDAILSDPNDLIKVRIQNEIALIERLITAIEISHIPFDMTVFNDFWQVATYPVLERLNEKIEWLLAVRYAGKPDFYQRLNIETYKEIWNLLKRVVDNNADFISDEIYLAQLYDKRFISIINNKLSKKKDQTLYEPSMQTKDKVIEIVYTPKTMSVIDMLIEELVTQSWRMPMPKKDSDVRESVDFLKTIITSFSVH